MQPLCSSHALEEGASRGLSLPELELFIVRRAGKVYAYRNRCPHRRVPLNWQPDQFLDDSASLVRCAQHGALFLIETGECLSGPCEGQPLEALDCVELDGWIWLQAANLA